MSVFARLRSCCGGGRAKLRAHASERTADCARPARRAAVLVPSEPSRAPLGPASAWLRSATGCRNRRPKRSATACRTHVAPMH
jgi:hypothetical protein